MEIGNGLRSFSESLYLTGKFSALINVASGLTKLKLWMFAMLSLNWSYD